MRSTKCEVGYPLGLRTSYFALRTSVMPLWFTFICLRRLRRFLEAWQAGIAAAGSKAELIFWPQQFNREECEPLMEESPAGVALALALPRVPAF